MRYWLSFRGPFGTRPGFGIGPEDTHPRLSSYRRYELRHGLLEAAKARGETMTKTPIMPSTRPWRPACSIPTAT